MVPCQRAGYNQALLRKSGRVFSKGTVTRNYFTIGHSTRPLDAFTDLLRESRIDRVVDVRSMPRSRSNPQFNLETLPGELARGQIGYEHITELGGLRGKQRREESSLNAYWRVRGFRNYADYALTPPLLPGWNGCANWASEIAARSCAEAMVALPPAHHHRLSSRGRG